MNILLRTVKVLLRLILDFIETFVMALSFFVIVYLFLIQPNKVKGSSMYPALEDEEYVLTNKIDYRFREPQRGDIIIFSAPHKKRFDFIKRIVGLPGERVSIKKGRFLIDGRVLDEGFYLQDVFTGYGAFLGIDEEIVVPEGQYFAVGDNRNHSSDSRDWGFVPRKNIIGKACFRYWPLHKAGAISRPVYSRQAKTPCRWRGMESLNGGDSSFRWRDFSSLFKNVFGGKNKRIRGLSALRLRSLRLRSVQAGLLAFVSFKS